MLDALTAIFEALPYLLKGALVTSGIVVGAMGLGLVMGVHMAVGQVYGNRAARWFVGLYVWFFRGVPVLRILAEADACTQTG